MKFETSTIFVLENEFQNIVCKINAILSRSLRVKKIELSNEFGWYLCAYGCTIP